MLLHRFGLKENINKSKYTFINPAVVDTRNNSLIRPNSLINVFVDALDNDRWFVISH